MLLSKTKLITSRGSGLSLNRSLQFITIGFAILLCGSSLLVSLGREYSDPSVGVKKGDWIEYNISITGTGSPSPTHDVRWMRMEVLPVQGAAFPVNLTTRYANGTIGSAIWDFNFTEGNVEGWIIIPSNIGPGATFYDSSIHTGIPVDVTIQGQEQKTVLGASRTVTYGSDSFRHKEWDKDTGVFVKGSERFKNVTNKDGWYIEDLTFTINAIATNMWDPQILGLDQTVIFGLVTAIALALLIWFLITGVSRNKKIKELALSPSVQGKIAVLTIIIAVFTEAAAIAFFPFYEMGLSVAEFNLILQTFWAAFVLMSMWFRMKSNYFVHEITMLIVMCQSLVGFSVVLLMDPMSFSSMEVLANTPTRLVMNFLHAIFSIPALAFGTWLVALWRPASTTYPAKSRRVAQLTAILWGLSYGVGVLDFLLLHTTVFG